MNEHARYQVIVGNVGTVYSGTCWIEACKVYGMYKNYSKHCDGRASRESVVLMDGDEIKYEFNGEDIGDTK